jgi:outer membrane protein
MIRGRVPVHAAALALHCAALAFLPVSAHAVGLSQLYDEALSSDAQLQSARGACRQ